MCTAEHLIRHCSEEVFVLFIHQQSLRETPLEFSFKKLSDVYMMVTLAHMQYGLNIAYSINSTQLASLTVKWVGASVLESHGNGLDSGGAHPNSFTGVRAHLWK